MLGPEGAAAVRAAALTGYPCAVCELPFDGVEPANALIAYDATREVIDFAHPPCAPATLVPLPPEAADPLRNAGAEGLDMCMAAALIGAAARPALLSEVRTQVRVSAAGGDRVDPVVSGLIGRGLTLLARPDQLPAVLPDWNVVMIIPDGRAATDEEVLAARIAVIDDFGALFFDGTIGVTEAWLKAVLLAGGECVLYYGVAGLYDLRRTPQAFPGLLDVAATQGRLVAGRIRGVAITTENQAAESRSRRAR